MLQLQGTHEAKIRPGRDGLSQAVGDHYNARCLTFSHLLHWEVTGTVVSGKEDQDEREVRSHSSASSVVDSYIQIHVFMLE